MAETVLVRRRSLGDVVLLGSVTGALDGVTVVTEPRYVEVAARLRGVTRAAPLGMPVRGRVVDLQRDLVTLRAFPWARRIHKRSLRRRLGLGRPAVPELYAEACGVRPVPTPWIDTPERGDRDHLALIPGASGAPKRWRPDRFAAVGRSWDGPVVVVGGPGEEPLVDAVVRGVPGARAVVGPGFADAIGALGRCRVAVGGDTGLLHLAAACGAVPVALFGPTSTADGFFPYPHGEVVQLSLPCRPCALHRVQACRVGHHGCMDQPVTLVVAAVRRACAG